jgi:hypothetical protein
MNNICTCPNYTNDNIVNCTCGVSFIKQLQETRNISNKQKYRKYHKRHKPLQVKSDLYLQVKNDLCKVKNDLYLQVKSDLCKVKSDLCEVKNDLCNTLAQLNLLLNEIKKCISKIKYKVYRNKLFLCSRGMSYFVNIGKMIIKTINNIRFDLHFYNVRINLLYTTNNIDNIEDLYNRCKLEYETCKEYIKTLYVYKILKRNIKIRKAKIYKKKLETIYE